VKYFALAFMITALLLAALFFAIMTSLGEDLASPHGHHDINQSVSTRLLDADGRLVDELFVEDRVLLAFTQIPADFLNAIIAIEDRRFYRHWGLDPVRVLRAAQRDIVQLEVREGASTITQQLARNLFLHHRRTWKRKIQEAVLALRIERAFSKDEILELYSNQIYFGEGAYGIEAAARRFCGAGASDLTTDQCAMLAGMVGNPAAFSPRRHPETCLRRRNLVLHAMVTNGSLDPSTSDSLMQLPLGLKAEGADSQYGAYFTEAVRRELAGTYGSTNIYHLGLTVETTLDLDLQKAAERIVEDHLRHIESVNNYPYLQGRPDLLLRRYGLPAQDSLKAPLRLQAALVAIEPATGAVRALIGGRDFTESEFNRAVQAPRQPASAFKPFIYAEAIRRGYRTNHLLLDAPVEFNIRGATPANAIWRPKNFDQGYLGPVTMRYALMKSINVPTARLLAELKPRPVTELAHRLGISGPLPEVLSLATGTGEARLIELTSAYSAFANHGIRVEPYFITSVLDQRGHQLQAHEMHSEQALDERTSYIITHMLQSALDRGTGHTARSVYGFRAPAAGKTGTNDDYTDAWYIGYTPNLAVGVWVGFDVKIPIGDARTGTGSAAALPIWAQVMNAAAERYGTPDFAVPERIVKVTTCLETGLLATPSCPHPIEDVYLPGTAPTQYCHAHGAQASPSDPIAPSDDFHQLDRDMLRRDAWPGTAGGR